QNTRALRHVEVVRLAGVDAMESRRRYAYDRERHINDNRSLADCLRGAAESPFCEAMADYRHRRGSFPVVIYADQPSSRRRQAQHVEEPAGDVQAVQSVPLLPDERRDPPCAIETGNGLQHWIIHAHDLEYPKRQIRAHPAELRIVPVRALDAPNNRR